MNPVRWGQNAASCLQPGGQEILCMTPGVVEDGTSAVDAATSSSRPDKTGNGINANDHTVIGAISISLISDTQPVLSYPSALQLAPSGYTSQLSVWKSMARTNNMFGSENRWMFHVINACGKHPTSVK